ncbi:MAG: prevent-host-death family protein [Proteobacteria bacterium]|nr:MAG: prevent-host-death family protein [Pseudomonadota bacterium]
MTKKSVSEAREEFSEVINQVSYSGQRVILHRYGKALAAIIPVGDLELLEAIEDSVDIESAQKALKEANKKGTIPWSVLKKELGL